MLGQKDFERKNITAYDFLNFCVQYIVSLYARMQTNHIFPSVKEGCFELVEFTGSPPVQGSNPCGTIYFIEK
jgi:hypothetical protein